MLAQRTKMLAVKSDIDGFVRAGVKFVIKKSRIMIHLLITAALSTNISFPTKSGKTELRAYGLETGGDGKRCFGIRQRSEDN